MVYIFWIVALGIVILSTLIGMWLSKVQSHSKLLMDIVLTYLLSLSITYGIWYLLELKEVVFSAFTITHFIVGVMSTAMIALLTTAVSNRTIILNRHEHDVKRKYVFAFLIIMVCCIFLELFVFNYRHYESVFNKHFETEAWNAGPGLWLNGDGSYTLLNEGERYIQVNNINQQVNNMHVQVRSGVEEFVNVTVQASDDGNQICYYLASRDVFTAVDQSQFFRLHLYGKAQSIRIVINGNENDIVYIDGLEFNVLTPINFSLPRFYILFILGSILYILRPKSELYQYGFNPKNSMQVAIIGILILLQIMLMWKIANANPAFVDPPWGHHLQYQKLTEALIKGQVYLDEIPTQTLVKLSNPYDSGLRSANNVQFLHDHAFYKDHYYVYFGIGPVLFLYLPAYLMTGTHMPNQVAVYIVVSLAIIAIFLLVGIILYKGFKKIPFLVYLILTSFFINSSGLLYIIKRPDFYNLPIAMALLFSVIGLFFWIWSIRGEKIIIGRLIAGSLFMALVATCRPQLLIGSFLALIIFKDHLFHKKRFFQKSNLFALTCFVMPFLLIATGVMYYNFIRFDSVFDFGARYNLTTNDMTHRGWVFDRIVLGLYAYLIQPASIISTFPFIQNSYLSTLYVGKTSIENPIAGVLSSNLLLVLAFFTFQFKRMIKSVMLYKLSVACTFFALGIIIVDTQAGGIFMRYISDFSWLLIIPAIIIAMSIIEHLQEKKLERFGYSGLVVFYCASLVMQFFGFFVDCSYSILTENPVLSAQFSYLIQFWN